MLRVSSWGGLQVSAHAIGSFTSTVLIEDLSKTLAQITIVRQDIWKDSQSSLKVNTNSYSLDPWDMILVRRAYELLII